MRRLSALVGRGVVSSCVAGACLLASAKAHAASIVLEGDVPSGGPDHFFVDLDVPEGTKEIEIRHDDLSDINILDFGLDGPEGPRGWGGGTTEPTIVNAQAASRGYVPGPITSGKWRVVVGKAKVLASPARYRMEVDLRTETTLAPVSRHAYVPAAARKTETRYYAGDLHVHSRESTDASATIEEDIALAKSRGLDWIEVSDHNTVTQLDFFNEIQAKYDDFLLVPGIEVTTYQGHANAIGATRYVDQKVGQPGVTIDSIADAVRGQGAIFSINHPVIDLDSCLGCAWKHDIDPKRINGVEIGTLGIEAGAIVFSARAIAFWDALLDKGIKVTAVGGSDDHRAGTATGVFPPKIGSPTTLVRATELSARAIVEGIAKGRTVVKLDGPADAMVELEAGHSAEDAAIAFPGDTVDAATITLRATVTGGVGQKVRFVKNGVPEEAVAVSSDPFVHTIVVASPGRGEDRWRAEALVDDRPRTVTSHIWLHEGGADRDDGCNAAPERRGLSPSGWALAAVAVIAFRLRKRRR